MTMTIICFLIMVAAVFGALVWVFISNVRDDIEEHKKESKKTKED